MEPRLIFYYDSTFGLPTYEYLVNEKEGKLYLISITTYQIAKMLGRVNELSEIDTHSIPKEWCSYKYETKKTFDKLFLPSAIAERKDEVFRLIDENFQYISRINEFFSAFQDYASHKDFVKSCCIAWIYVQNHLPKGLLQTLFDLIFDFYQDLVGQNEFKLLLEPRVGPYYANYLEA